MSTVENQFSGSLKFRVATLVSVIVFCLLALYTYNYAHEKSNYSSIIVQKQAESLADYFAESSHSLVTKNDTEGLRKRLSDYLKLSDVMDVRYFGVMGEIQYSGVINNVDQKDIVRFVESTITGDEYITVWRPVNSGDDPVWLQLKYNLATFNKINNEFKMSGIRDGIIYSLLISLLVGFVLLVILNNPMKVIKSASEYIDKLDISRKSDFREDSSFTELNQLTTSINSTQNRLFDGNKSFRATLFALEMQNDALNKHSIVCVCDSNGEIYFANDKFCDISQYSLNELYGMNYTLLASEYQSKDFIKNVWESISDGQVWHGELENSRKDGSVFWVDTTIMPYDDLNDNSKKYIVIMTDTSSRKIYERELVRLAEFPERNPNLIVSASVEKGLIYMNPAMGEMLKELYKNDSTMNVSDLMPENYQAIIADCISTEEEKGSFEVTALDKTWLWRFSPVGGQNIVHGYGIDITQRIAAENELRDNNRDLELLKDRLEYLVNERTIEIEAVNRNLVKADRVKNDFLATVSHELRTPLTSIKSFSEILKEDIEELDVETQVRYLSIIDKESDRLERLISNILDLQKLDEEEVVWRDESVNIVDVVKSSVATFIGAFQEKGIKLITEIDADYIELTIDSDKIRQVVANLVSNALKFTHQGEVIIGVKETVSNETTDKDHYAKGSIRIWISDTGIGIDKDNRDVIFERFKQVDSSSTREYGGTGLGLSISKQIVEHYNGAISVDSTTGKGTTFFIDFPKNNSQYGYRRESA